VSIELLKSFVAEFASRSEHVPATFGAAPA
jgi:hypothetical protein